MEDQNIEMLKNALHVVNSHQITALVWALDRIKVDPQLWDPESCNPDHDYILSSSVNFTSVMWSVFTQRPIVSHRGGLHLFCSTHNTKPWKWLAHSFGSRCLISCLHMTLSCNHGGLYCKGLCVDRQPQ